MEGLSVGGALGVIGLLAALAVVLFVGAIPAMQHFGFGFFVGTEWDPVQREFGALPFIYGTFVSSLLALCIAVPISIGAALFLTRIAPKWLSGPISFLIELLAAIPSIVYGFWGVAWLVPFLQSTGMPFLKSTLGQVPVLGNLFSGPAYGASMLAAGIVMALMVVPIITAVTRDVLMTIPKEIEEGAYALGATWWQSCLAILNFGKLGIFGAIVLGFARAIGETMAVTMVIGNNNQLPVDQHFSLFAPGQTMASLLANEFQNADNPMYVHSLIFLALVLLLLTLVMNGAARIMLVRMKNAGNTKIKARKLPADKQDIFDSTNASDTASNVAASNNAAKQLPNIKISQLNLSVRYVNVVFKSLCIAAALFAIAFLVMIFSYVLYKGLTSLSWDFFLMNPGPPENHIGMKNAIVGTIILVGLASCFGIPFGMLCGIYLSEYAKKSWFNDVVRLVVDVLAGTPSIIVGVLAYELIVAPNGTFPGLGLGYSGWGGAMALAFLMIPIISKTTEEMLNLVPISYREASAALGGAKYQTILKVVLPAALSGIVTGIMLAVARVAGETAPLIFTALGSSSDVYDPRKPFPALTLKIYEYAQSAEPKWIEQAWAGMLVLIIMITMLSAAVRYVTRSKKKARI